MTSSLFTRRSARDGSLYSMIMASPAAETFGSAYAIPKKRGPFHRVPVISRAMALNDRYFRDWYSKPSARTVTTMRRSPTILVSSVPTGSVRWTDRDGLRCGGCAPVMTDPFTTGRSLKNVRSASSANSEILLRARWLSPPSALACNCHAMRRKSKSRFDDLGSSPSSSRYLARNWEAVRLRVRSISSRTDWSM